MSKCSIICCGLTRRDYQQKITFHRLPKIEHKKKKWLDLIGAENIRSGTKRIYICSLHFEENCFNRTLDIVKLRDDALPSRFLMPHAQAVNRTILTATNKPDPAPSTSSTTLQEHIAVKLNPASFQSSIAYFNNKKDAIPSELSTGSNKEILSPECSNSDEEPDQLQVGYYCNICCQIIQGFRFICVECDDFDLCTGCEIKGEHPDHFILRVPESKSNDEITTVLERIRKELLEDKTTIDDSLKIKIKERDPLADVENDADFPENSDIQLLCTETDYLEEDEFKSGPNGLQKRKLPESDQFVPLKRQSVTNKSTQNNSNTLNTEDEKSKAEDAAYPAFVYRKITVFPPSIDNCERKMITVTTPFLTKITNVNQAKESKVTNNIKPNFDDSTSHLDEEIPYLSGHLQLNTDKVVEVTPKVSSESKMMATNVSQLTSEFNMNGNLQKHYTQPIDIKPLNGRQLKLSNISQVTAKSDICMSDSRPTNIQPNTRPMAIPKSAILKNDVRTDTKIIVKPVSQSKIAVTNQSHLKPKHNIVTTEVQRKQIKKIVSTTNKSTMTNDLQITRKSNAMTSSREDHEQKARLIKQSIANLKYTPKTYARNVTKTLPPTSDNKMANISYKMPKPNIVSTELQKNRTSQSDSVTKQLQKYRKPQLNTVTTGIQQNKTSRPYTVTKESQHNWTAQSNILTENNIQQVPGRGNHQSMTAVPQNIYCVAPNIQSVIPIVSPSTVMVPSFINQMIPNLMPPPAPDLILELSQNERENGININVKRMTSEEKDLLIKR